MGFYPDYEHTNIPKDVVITIPNSKNSFYRYVQEIAKKWCNNYGINYHHLVVTLLLAVLDGDIKVEETDTDMFSYYISRKQTEKLAMGITVKNITYNIANKYGVSINTSKNDEIFMGYRTYLLDKLGGI